MVQRGKAQLVKLAKSAASSSRRLIIVWDGDDVCEGSFTEVLHAAAAELAQVPASVALMYAKSTRNGTRLRPPAGLDLLSGFHVHEVIAGRASTSLDLQLERTMADTHRAERQGTMKDYLEEQLGPRFNPRVVSSWTSELPTTFGRDVWGGYGYWLLGVSILKISGVQCIVYIGGKGAVSSCEYRWVLRNMPDVTQIMA